MVFSNNPVLMNFTILKNKKFYECNKISFLREPNELSYIKKEVEDKIAYINQYKLKIIFEVMKLTDFIKNYIELFDYTQINIKNLKDNIEFKITPPKSIISEYYSNSDFFNKKISEISTLTYMVNEKLPKNISIVGREGIFKKIINDSFEELFEKLVKDLLSDVDVVYSVKNKYENLFQMKNLENNELKEIKKQLVNYGHTYGYSQRYFNKLSSDLVDFYFENGICKIKFYYRISDSNVSNKHLINKFSIVYLNHTKKKFLRTSDIYLIKNTIDMLRNLKFSFDEYKIITESLNNEKIVMKLINLYKLTTTYEYSVLPLENKNKLLNESVTSLVYSENKEEKLEIVTNMFKNIIEL